MSALALLCASGMIVSQAQSTLRAPPAVSSAHSGVMLILSSVNLVIDTILFVCHVQQLKAAVYRAALGDAAAPLLPDQGDAPLLPNGEADPWRGNVNALCVYARPGWPTRCGASRAGRCACDVRGWAKTLGRASPLALSYYPKAAFPSTARCCTLLHAELNVMRREGSWLATSPERLSGPPRTAAIARRRAAVFGS